MAIGDVHLSNVLTQTPEGIASSLSIIFPRFRIISPIYFIVGSYRHAEPAAIQGAFAVMQEFHATTQALYEVTRVYALDPSRAEIRASQ
jgi:uncharacterized protein YybS (DUF2232 family)